MIDNPSAHLPIDGNPAVVLTRDAIDGMARRVRTNLVNSLSGFKSANLLGTCAASGATNLSLVSSVFHVGANPPLMGMLLRPHTVPRHSLENLLDTGVYTLNAVNETCYPAAHQASARYPREQSEFDACGLTAIRSEAGHGPYVAESPLQIALTLIEHQTLACNATVLVIGEIQEVRMQSDERSEDGWFDPGTLGITAISGLDAYHRATMIDRLPYAKAGNDT